MTNLTPKMERLAAEIGENIYIDLAKWHLYLADAHLHIPLSQKLYPLIEDDDLTVAKVTTVLRSIPVSLGAGKLTVNLFDLLPETEFKNLMGILEDYQADF